MWKLSPYSWTGIRQIVSHLVLTQLPEIPQVQASNQGLVCSQAGPCAGTPPRPHRAGSGLAWSHCSSSIHPPPLVLFSSSWSTSPPAPSFLPPSTHLSSPSSPSCASSRKLSLSILFPLCHQPRVSFLSSDLELLTWNWATWPAAFTPWRHKVLHVPGSW